MQNIVILAGNIGQKPEVRSTQSGTKITNFTLATSRPRLSEGRVMRDENGFRVVDTEWHRITCFNGLGKTVAEHCEKGMKVLVHPPCSVFDFVQGITRVAREKTQQDARLDMEGRAKKLLDRIG